ncbi:MAG TPA: hypothetical protein VMV41_09745 [Cellulomonadaceae bacterium]|nr:hypothetical protein [Cellulomonadaceae bacterium]
MTVIAEFVGGPLDGETRVLSDARTVVERAAMMLPVGGEHDGALLLGTMRYQLRHSIEPLAIYDYDGTAYDKALA